MIVSKFRDLYIAKFIFFFVLAFLILLLSIFLSFKELSQEDFLTVVTLGFFSLFVLVIIIFEIKTIKKIRVFENYIENRILFSNKIKTVNFSKINSIAKVRVNGLYNVKSGTKITDDYFQTKIIYNDNLELFISPNEYENYEEMIQEIKLRLEEIKNSQK